MLVVDDGVFLVRDFLNFDFLLSGVIIKSIISSFESRSSMNLSRSINGLLSCFVRRLVIAAVRGVHDGLYGCVDMVLFVT